MKTLVQNKSYFLIWPDNLSVMPDEKMASDFLKRVRILQERAPHLPNATKRTLKNRSFSWTQSLFHIKSYPFKNGQQANTKDSIVWTDFIVMHWPLVILLLQLCHELSYDQVIKTFFANDKTPDWKIITDTLEKKGLTTNIVEVDLLDQWFDEVSITQIEAQNYHQLYRWFGNSVKDIGYAAFDYFMEDRNGRSAWQRAIEQHLKSISNLPEEHLHALLQCELIKLIPA